MRVGYPEPRLTLRASRRSTPSHRARVLSRYAFPTLQALLILATQVAASPAAPGIDPAECAAVQKAYEAFRSSSFRMDRDLSAEVDGKPKGRVVARLNWKDGKLEETIVSSDAAKGESIEVHGDPSLKLAVSCARITPRPDEEWEIDSGGGERVVFRLDRARGALVPLRWTAAQTVKVLFLKKRISMAAEIREFRWE